MKKFIIKDEEVHRRARIALENGDTVKRRRVYALAKRRVVASHAFFGHGSWAKYLAAQHNVGIRSTKQPSKPSDAELHELVSKGLQTQRISASQWCGPSAKREYINGKRFPTVFEAVETRIQNGEKFFGTGSWNAYLEKFHRVVPLDQMHWSDERTHKTIAAYLKQYPPEKVNWQASSNFLNYITNLRSLYQKAYRSNNSSRKQKPTWKFFGHETWNNYVKWIRENYG